MKTRDQTYSPVILDFPNGLAPSQVRKLAFGEYSAALTFNGEIYVWGLANMKEPTLIKAEPAYKTPDQTLASQRVSIPNTLFRELKLNHHLLTALDVDNSLWHWGLHESEKLKQYLYPEDLIKP